jgi:sec-independent protein translocase protein TatA
MITAITNFIEYLKSEKMGNFGATEIILILLVVILLFGARKIPELMRGIGQGMKEFKKASKVEDDSDKDKFSAEDEKKSEE